MANGIINMSDGTLKILSMITRRTVDLPVMSYVSWSSAHTHTHTHTHKGEGKVAPVRK